MTESGTVEVEPFVGQRLRGNSLGDPEVRSLKVLYFECGTRDEYRLQCGARILARALSA